MTTNTDTTYPTCPACAMRLWDDNGLARHLADAHPDYDTAALPAAPTATAKLVRTIHRTLVGSAVQVSVVRVQEPGELAVWTIHRDGDRPIYVALTQADAFRVAAAHAR